MAEGPEMVQQEIADLERQLREKREELSSRKESGELTELPHEKETLREIVKERIVEGSAPKGLPPSQPAPPPTPVIEPPVQLSEELQSKVQSLVNVAFTSGLSAAIEKATATNNAALIDAFHDLLVDELYSHLIERGKLKDL